MLLNSFFARVTQDSITLPGVLLCTGVSLLLGVLIALFYMRQARYTKSFAVTLALLPAMVEIVILLVNGNLGTGVAVAGAFGLVRFRSLPGSALPPINTVERIPDLAESDLHGPAVYQLYRAGIFAGSDASGSFRPNRSITRAETAALAVRMTDPDRRVSFSLTGSFT